MSGSYLPPVCLPLRLEIYTREIPGREAKSMASPAGLCDSQTVAVEAQSWQRVAPPRDECILFAALDTRTSEASRSSVEFAGPQKRDVVWRAEKDGRVDLAAVQHKSHQCVAISVIPSLIRSEEFHKRSCVASPPSVWSGALMLCVATI